MVRAAPTPTSTDLATAPAALMTDWLAADKITTSSEAVGTIPLLQLEAVFQSVLVQPVQMVPTAALVSTPVLLVMAKVPPLRFCTVPVLVPMLLYHLPPHYK